MSFVYFIKPIGMPGPIKIGCSHDPVKRLKQLMVWSPFPLEIVAAFPSQNGDESAVQGQFSARRLHGEWFAESPDLAEMMERIRNGLPVDRESADFRAAKSAMRVAAGVKSHLTKRVNLSEKLTRKMGVAVIRPDHIRQTISEYSGPDKPAPTAEHRALIDLYVRELRFARSGLKQAAA